MQLNHSKEILKVNKYGWQNRYIRFVIWQILMCVQNAIKFRNIIYIMD